MLATPLSFVTAEPAFSPLALKTIVLPA